MSKVKHRAVIKFLTKPGTPVQTIIEEMSAVYQQGRESLEDDLRPGRPIEVTTLEHVEKIYYWKMPF